MTRYLIVGNGVAAASAAEKIAAADPQARLTMLSQETDFFYYRPRLPEVLSGQATLARITLAGADWYAARGIALLQGVKAVGLDPQARTVSLDDGRTLPYDRLLLATGAAAMIPPVPGADRPGVFALRTAQDARAIARAAAGAKTAILIGGGLLGLEAGAALARLGLAVHVAEFAERLLPRQMDAAGAAKLQALLEAKGFSFLLGARSKAITGAPGDMTLSLEDSRTVRGDLVLFSAGIRGNLDLARQAGLTIDKGLVVDDHLRTSHPDIWAAGDHIEHRGRLYGLWIASKAQGAVAGANMAGGQVAYAGTTPGTTLKVTGVDLASVGNIDAEGKHAAVVFQDAARYRKIVLQDGRIAGFIFFGLTRGVKQCQQALERGLDVSAHAAALADEHFDFDRLLA